MPQNLPKPGAPKHSASKGIVGNPLRNSLFLIGAIEDDEDYPEKEGRPVKPDWTYALVIVGVVVVLMILTAIISLLLPK